MKKNELAKTSNVRKATKSTMTPEERRLFNINPNHMCTENMFIFLNDYYRVMHSFLFTTDLAHRADEVRVTASAVLIDGEKDEAKRAELQRSADDKNATVRQLQQFSEIYSRQLVTGTVDAFLWYLSASVQSIMRRQPNILRSNETLTIDEIMDFNNRSELINYLADKKMNSLSYGGIRSMEKYFKERIGIDLITDQDEFNLMSMFIELRNVNCHNRGVINATFLSRVQDHKGFPFAEGKRFHVDFESFAILARACLSVADNIDAAVSKKFKIPRKRFRTWKKAHVTG